MEVSSFNYARRGFCYGCVGMEMEVALVIGFGIV